MEIDKSHPDYSEGFWAAQDGAPLPDGASEHYAAGWNAAHKIAGIFTDAGFKRQPDGSFSKTMVIERRR